METNSTGGGDDKNKKATKVPAKPATGTQEGLSEGSVLVDSSQFKYLADIYNEATNTGIISASKSFVKLIKPFLKKYLYSPQNRIGLGLGLGLKKRLFGSRLKKIYFLSCTRVSSSYFIQDYNATVFKCCIKMARTLWK